MAKLYIVPTPIGNLDDITLRAVNVLREVDFILAEDTRTTSFLLRHLGIEKKLHSHHKFNEHATVKMVAGSIAAGRNAALVSDAGTPGISDPGEELVRMCYEEGITVTAVPGASACVSALTISGLPTRRFAFEAFLPSDKKEREAVLSCLEKEQRTIVLYEAPHRLIKTLKMLGERLGDRRVSVCRELTKRHETVYRSTLLEAVSYYEENLPKGECVLVIEGLSREEIEQEEQKKWSNLSIEEHMEYYLSQGIDKKEAMKKTAKDRGVQKREIYNYLEKLKSGEGN